jgi:hypothetical protein
LARCHHTGATWTAAATGTYAAGAPGVTASLLAPRPPSLLPDPDPLLLTIPKETGRTWQLQQHHGWFTGLVEEHHDGSIVEQVAEDAGDMGTKEEVKPNFRTPPR